LRNSWNIPKKSWKISYILRIMSLLKIFKKYQDWYFFKIHKTSNSFEKFLKLLKIPKKSENSYSSWFFSKIPVKFLKTPDIPKFPLIFCKISKNPQNSLKDSWNITEILEILILWPISLFYDIYYDFYNKWEACFTVHNTSQLKLFFSY
jgi:hypothetical protein